MQHPVSELTEFYDALSRYLTGGGRDPGASVRYAIEAIIGGYMLEKLYNGGAMKYLMFKATKD